MSTNLEILEQDRTETEWSGNELRMLRHLCERYHLPFTQYFFKKRDMSKFITGEHHRIMARFVDQVFNGVIKRGIINVPPGYTKTEEVVIALIARGLAINKRAKFLHASYSDSLALLNSTQVKDVVTSDAYQELWPCELRADSKSKKAWYNEHGGGLYAVATGGQVTGFRAGRNSDDPTDFPGALIIDDPIKPDDAYSKVVRESINERYNNTLRSRLLNEDVPVLLIMQRVHENDMTDFLLSGGSGEKWHHLCMPAYNEHGGTPPIPDKYKDYSVPFEYTLPKGPLWEYKHNVEQLDAIKNARTPKNQSSGIYVFNSQYQQAPASSATGIFKKEWFGYYETLPTQWLNIKIIVDTAMKDGEDNDYSVFMLCGTALDASGAVKLYVIDVWRDHWDVVALIKNATVYWGLYRKFKIGFMEVAGANSFLVEDKAHGTALIRALKDPQHDVPCVAIPRNTTKLQRNDKVSRAMACVPHVQGGRVMLPSGANSLTKATWVSAFVNEVATFNEGLTHEHDDQCDVLFDGIEFVLRGSTLHSNKSTTAPPGNY